MTHASRALVATLTLAHAWPLHAAAAPPSSTAKPVDLNDIRLPPEAKRLNELGMDAYRAGDFETAYRELKRSYASMDPRADIDARDMVLASLRSALVKLYEKTGDLRHLCLARTELLLHLEALLVTFGEDTDLPDIPGIRWRLRQINEKITRHPPRLGEPTCDGPALRNERAAPPRTRTVTLPPPPPLPDRGRPAIIVGATTLGAGGLLVGAMTYALLMRRANNDGLHALATSASSQPEGLLTREQRTLADSLLQAGSYHRTSAIATGISGGVLALTGIAALIAGRVLRGKSRRLAVHPAPSRTGGALLLTTRF